MSFPTRPNYSKSQIKKASKDLVKFSPSSQKYKAAIKIVNKWRIAHAYPINTFNSYLRKQVKANVKNKKQIIIAQRLKRLPTIIDKLKRHPHMSLTTMQDIGGLRAIVRTVDDVQKIKESYTNSSNITHIFKKTNDYIKKPKTSGYRGVHLIYQYRNTKSRNKIANTYNGLLLEIQIRTQLQHLWATAVETISIFNQEDYKSGKGKKYWLKFFSLVSTIFALVEKSPVPTQYKNIEALQIIDEIIKIDNKHHLLDKLSGYSFAIKILPHKKDAYYNVIVLNYKSRTVHIEAYRKDQISEASDYLSKLENDPKIKEKIDTVLVSAGNLKIIKQAYPNYFLDLGEFIRRLKLIVKEGSIL